MDYVVQKRPVEGDPWAFIAVMGVTGSGKSSFIKWATENEDIVIGHDLNSCTSKITGYTFNLNGCNINLVDTPGFNDTHKSETEVLQDIAQWLKGNYERNTRLNGIIYLHSLANVRMEGSALRNLKMFRQLVGKEPLKNVILATTFWSEVAKDDLLRREDQLRATPDFWGDMLDRGSQMHRLVVPQDSLRIIAQLVQKPPVTLQIQTELVENHMPLVDTAAGQAVNEELARLEQKHKEELERVKRELHEAMEERDHEMQQVLQQQQKRLDKQLDKVKHQQDLLAYDRRADRRRMENEFQSRFSEMEEELKQRHMKEMEELNFDQAVAVVRANEGKIPVREREQLEQKIAELEKELAEDSNRVEPGKVPARKKKGSSRYLFTALKIAFPVASIALLGVPIFSPFGNGGGAGGLMDKVFGGGGAEA